MKFELITLFPDYFHQSLRQSLLGKALEKKLFEIEIINLRDFTTDRHRTVDDKPFGGKGGMVLKIEPLDQALRKLGHSRKSDGAERNEKERIVLTSAAGKQYNQQTAIQYSLCERLTIICGHYLGIDERLSELYHLDEVSIGDYVLTGGEPAAAVIVDSVARLMPQVLGNFESALDDSCMDQIVGSPCYTRPVEYRGLNVPEVLRTGDHEKIRNYRRSKALKKCSANRPDLLRQADLTDEDKMLLENINKDMKAAERERPCT